ncbi:MAG: hypothetical protein V4608_14385 [Bacteroidota bacterium]
MKTFLVIVLSLLLFTTTITSCRTHQPCSASVKSNKSLAKAQEQPIQKSI